MNRLLTLRLYYALCFIALGVYLPFFPRWLEARGIHGAAMGVIAASLPAMGLIGPPLFGVVSDALGLRGALLRVACAGAFASMGALGIAFVLGYPLGFAGIFVATLSFAFFRSPLSSLADVIAMEVAGSGAGYARTRRWGSVGFAVGALAVGRYLDVTAPARLPLAIAVPLLGALLAAWRMPTRTGRPPAPALGNVGALLGHRGLRLFLGVAFLAQIAGANYDLCLTLHLRDLGASSGFVSAAWAMGVAAEIALMSGSGWILPRFRPQALIAVALATAAVRWTLIASVTSVPVLIALQPLHAVTFGIVWLASLAYVKSSAPPSALATAQGLFSAALAAGSVIGMPLWGALYHRFGGAFTFHTATIVSAAAALLALVWARATSVETSPRAVTTALAERAQ